METRHQVFAAAEPRRLLKAKVQVCGRFLLRPEEDFGPEQAGDLAGRSAKDGMRIRTSLQLFTNGIRLGDSGIFASMPLEHIQYQRIAACISPGQQPRMLALCTKDYEQKCVTVVQFKSADALAEAGRLIERQRRLAAEEVNYLSDAPQRSSSSNNWALMETAQTQQTPTAADSPSAASQQQQQQQQLQVPLGMRPAPLHHEARVTVTSARSAAAIARSSSSADDVFYAVAEPPRTTGPIGGGSRRGERQIDSVVLNYDDVAGAGTTHAVFESNRGPPTLLNERVVTSQSNGASARPATLRVQTELVATTKRRDDDRLDGGSVRPRVTYVTVSANGGQRASSQQQQQQSVPQQQMQLVKLVPVRRQIHHHQQRHQQQVALYPAGRGSLGRGYYLLTK